MPVQRLWVPSIERAKDVSGAVFAAGYPGEYALDNNLDTYSKASGTTKVVKIDIDPSGVTASYNWVGVWVHNYGNAAFTAPGQNILLESDSADTFPSPTTILASTAMAVASFLPLFAAIVNGGTPVTERFLRLTFSGSGIVQETSLVMLGTYYDLDVLWEWEDIDAQVQEFNSVDELPGGQELVTRHRGVGSRVWVRRYVNLTTAQVTVLRAAHAAAGGRFQPFILQDNDETIKLSKLVKFTEDRLNAVPMNNDLWNVDMGLREVPYIRANYRY
jgi:hypothetical protein